MKKLYQAMTRLFKSNPNRIDGEGFSRLQRAIKENDHIWAELLIKGGADVNDRAGLVMPPLHMALRNNCDTIAVMLIEAGADVNLPDANGEAPLHIAVQRTQEYMTRLLIDHGADPTLRNEKNGKTPLHYLSGVKQTVIGLLRDNGADVNAQDYDGNTPLHHFYNIPHLAETLVAEGAAVNCKNHAGKTPFQHALGDVDHLRSRTATVLSMVRAGADMAARDSTGRTLLQVTAKYGLNALFDAVLDKSDVTLCDDAGRNVLHFLVENVNTDALDVARIHVVLDHATATGTCAAAVNRCNANGHTPLGAMMSSRMRGNRAWGYAQTHRNYIAAVRAMLDAGADINTCDSDGRTLLHHAVEDQHMDLLVEVIRRGIALDAVDRDGKAALQLAIARKSLSYVDKLLDAGADPDLTDADGWTVLDRLSAADDRTSPIVQRLITAGARYNKQLPLYPDLMRDKSLRNDHVVDKTTLPRRKPGGGFK